MRRMLIPLAGLTLLNLVGCHLVMGKCDCDGPLTRPVTAMFDYLRCSIFQTAAQPPAAPVAELLKEMPHVTPDK
jgi:hypothetical protein